MELREEDPMVRLQSTRSSSSARCPSSWAARRKSARPQSVTSTAVDRRVVE
jgi:hypothetical protein